MNTKDLDRRLIAQCEATAPRRARTTSQLAPLMHTVHHLRRAGHTWPTIVAAFRCCLNLPQLADSTLRAAYQCWLGGQSAEHAAAPKPSRARRAAAATAPENPAGQTAADRPEPAALTPHRSASHPAEEQQLLAV
jgi:hypothetical protein